MISRFRTFIAGFLVLLPLAVTLAVIVWVGSFIFAYLGPDSAIGRILLSIGFNFSDSPAVAYALGAVVVIGLIYLLGVAVESRLESRIRSALDSLMQRIPFVGNLYDVTRRFVAIMEQRDQDGLKSMSPVWCSFGGEVLAWPLGLRVLRRGASSPPLRGFPFEVIGGSISCPRILLDDEGAR